MPVITNLAHIGIPHHQDIMLRDLNQAHSLNCKSVLCLIHLQKES
ncbi:hypothetical protein CTRC46_00820 [Chlamydia trachomatis RC-L2(s)/46]|nr:hypothetical protein CTRC46_00820 [Chlamydia trachomatis RC-L2(s)/46]